ncbi:hypothetical protein DH2020_037386 [Rehmannia glutinosa]|uniref:Endonuclease/exonuclease/phosphatase domain-containing protein n=1 Tax=Rehmannia glutinosa TaxID=99300 RepID=A0ABR0V338_REHGL
MEVDIKSYSCGHIDSVVQDGDKNWRFTGFYGNPDSSKRRDSWKLMRRLAQMPDLHSIPWIVGGDFNEIYSSNEKSGGRRRPESQMEDFRNVVEECELRELYGDGDFFTWVNRRSGDEMIFERLDRFFTTLTWRLMYPCAKVTNLEFYSSDHRAIWLQLRFEGREASDGLRQKARQFRFEKYWTFEDDCKQIIEQVWRDGNGDGTLMNRIERCKVELQTWVGVKFKSLPKKLKKSRDKLNCLKKSNTWAKSENEIKELENSLQNLAYGKKCIGSNGRNNWLRYTAINSTYFHAQATKLKN